MSKPGKFHFNSYACLFWLWLWFCQSDCASVNLTVLLSIWLYFCQTDCASVNLTVLLSAWLCFCQSDCASVNLTIVLSVWLFDCGSFSAGMSTSVLVNSLLIGNYFLICSQEYVLMMTDLVKIVLIRNHILRRRAARIILRLWRRAELSEGIPEQSRAGCVLRPLVTMDTGSCQQRTPAPALVPAKQLLAPVLLSARYKRIFHPTLNSVFLLLASSDDEGWKITSN